MADLPTLTIVHDDHGFLAVAKPSGLSTLPGRGIPAGDSVRERLEVEVGTKLIPVHRLDRGTSGALLFAKDVETHRALNELFESRQVAKTYLALAMGLPRADTGMRDRPLLVDQGERVLEARPGDAGSEAVTRWQVIKVAPAPESMGVGDHDLVLLEVRPTTGRRHQIRVHLSGMGCPILGDSLYAPAPVKDAWPRLCLHASAIQFRHPTTGNPVEIVVSVPNDLPKFMQSS